MEDLFGELQHSRLAESALKHAASIWQAGALYVCAIIVYKLLFFVLTAVFVLVNSVLEIVKLVLNKLIVYPMLRKNLQKGTVGLVLLCSVFVFLVIHFESYSNSGTLTNSATNRNLDLNSNWDKAHRKKPVHFPKTRQGVYDAYNDRIFDVISNVTREERHRQQVRDTQRLRNDLIAEDLIGETDFQRRSQPEAAQRGSGARRRKTNSRKRTNDDVTAVKRPSDASIPYKKIVPVDDVSVDDHFMRLLRNAQRAEKVFYNRVPKCGSEGVVAMIRSVAKEKGFRIERSHVHNERYLNESQQVRVIVTSFVRSLYIIRSNS